MTPRAAHRGSRRSTGSYSTINRQIPAEGPCRSRDLEPGRRVRQVEFGWGVQPVGLEHRPIERRLHPAPAAGQVGHGRQHVASRLDQGAQPADIAPAVGEVLQQSQAVDEVEMPWGKQRRIEQVALHHRGVCAPPGQDAADLGNADVGVVDAPCVNAVTRERRQPHRAAASQFEGGRSRRTKGQQFAQQRAVVVTERSRGRRVGAPPDVVPVGGTGQIRTTIRGGRRPGILHLGILAPATGTPWCTGRTEREGNPPQPSPC